MILRLAKAQWPPLLGNIECGDKTKEASKYSNVQKSNSREECERIKGAFNITGVYFLRFVNLQKTKGMRLAVKYGGGKPRRRLIEKHLYISTVYIHGMWDSQDVSCYVIFGWRLDIVHGPVA